MNTDELIEHDQENCKGYVCQLATTVEEIQKQAALVERERLLASARARIRPLKDHCDDGFLTCLLQWERWANAELNGEDK
jgi:hypothetical protein